MSTISIDLASIYDFDRLEATTREMAEVMNELSELSATNDALLRDDVKQVFVKRGQLFFAVNDVAERQAQLLANRERMRALLKRKEDIEMVMRRVSLLSCCCYCCYCANPCPRLMKFVNQKHIITK